MTTKTYYHLFSRVVSSELPLPLPAVDTQKHSAEIHLESSQAYTSFPNKTKHFSIDLNREASNFFSPDLGLFRLLSGNSISISPAEGADMGLLTTVLLGLPMGALEYQWGRFVFHGSAVASGGSAWIFLGPSKAGKSTTALSFAAQNYSLLTDDIASLDMDAPQGITVTPSYPGMKIGHDAINFYRLPKEKLRSYATGIPKKRYDISSNFSESPKKLTAIFILEWGGDFSLNKLSPSEALIKITPHAIGPEPRTKYPVETAVFFKNTVRLVEKIPCFTLTRPLDMRRLPELPGFVSKNMPD